MLLASPFQHFSEKSGVTILDLLIQTKASVHFHSVLFFQESKSQSSGVLCLSKLC